MRVVALTGAGISASAGIPTFFGNWEGKPLRHYLTREYANANPDKFGELMDHARKKILAARPTAAHFALAQARVPIVTQNVEGLHTKAGSTGVLEPHGNLFEGNIVLYGDELRVSPKEMLALMLSADWLLVIGCSLVTLPVGLLPEAARQQGVKVHYINSDADHKVPEWLKRKGLL